MSSTPLKRRLTSCAGEVYAIADAGRTAAKDSRKVSIFKGMFRALERYYQKFEETWEELIELADRESVEEAAASAVAPGSKFPTEADRTLQANTRRYYYEANGTYEALLAQSSSRVAMPPPDVNNTTQIIHESRSDLPIIPLPKFDGELMKWPHFRDTFTAIMSENSHLTPQKKFIYLKSALSDQAATIISSLPVEQQNFELAWNALTKAFDNKRVLATAYLNQILDFKPIQGNATIQSLKEFLTKISDSVAAFQLMKIEKESDFILFFLAIRCLDPRTREQFEMSVKPDNEFPTFEQLTNFIRSRVTALQLASSSNPISSSQSSSKNKSSKPNKPHTSLISSNENEEEKNSPSNENNANLKCIICKKEKHGIASCSKFLDGSPSQRVEWLKRFKGCKNCLAYNHKVNSCKSKFNCRHCKKRHNSYLHLDNYSPSGGDDNAKQNSTSQGTNTEQLSSLQCCIANQEPEVVLGTAVVEILDARNRFQQIRLVVDCGSQHSFISQSCLRRLGLNAERFSRKISGIGQTAAEGATGKVRCTLRPRNKRSVNLTTEAVVIKNITTFLPNSNLPHNLYHAYLQFELADPKFFQSAPIDFLLGAELFGDIWNGPVITVDPDSPKVYPSIFGHIVMGRYSAPDASSPSSTSLFAFSEEDNLHADLQRFWELEEPKSVIFKNPEEEKCEEHFRKTHYRLPSGQYVVRLPFKNDTVPDLSASSNSAVKRLYNLENKLRSNEELRSQYHDFIREFINLGHMSLTTATPKFVIPHHSIVKEDRNLLKLRVVFDGSATTPNNGSLNDHLMPGEKLQKDIRDILLNFRAHAYVFVADIVKMFRCILVDPEDRPYQCIKWRFDRADSVQTYEINTCVYGLTSSPWLALRVIQQLQADEGHNFPLAAEVLNRDIYVDDFATGSNTLSSALELQDQLIKILEKGGFALSKWASNSSELLDAVAESASELPIPLDSHEEVASLKILGIEWDPTTDTFSYRINIPATASTKRRVLSCVARIFDPLGLVAPTVFLLKAFIQELWKNGLTWDQSMPSELQKRWDVLMIQLPELSHVQVPRFVASTSDCQYQLVAFCDASDKGYCAVVYLRTIHADGAKVSLLTAKTKLATLKFVSTPRKELCGAVLLAELYSSLSNFLKFFENNLLEPQFFTDSSTVLSWLNTPPFRLKTFVANRVSLILQHTSLSCWRHIDSELNPGDCGSRGLLPNELLNHSLWWNGPPWLEKPMSQWPTPNFTLPEVVPELKKTSTAALISTHDFPTAFLEWMKRFSSFHELLRVVAVLLRGISNFQNQPNVRDGPLLPADIESAMVCCVKAVQSELLTEKNRKKGIQKVYSNLAPFLDEKGVWRVGGRIRHAQVPYNMKHPILLPAHSHFTIILTDYYHRCYLHPSPATLQALLQTRFWIVPSLRRLVRHRTASCVDCRKRNAKPIAPPMGDLPAYRLQTKRAFAHTGVDFAGPFVMRESLRRKAHTSKIYLALFVCMETKALHLEPVTQLTTDAFLASFDRFASRRGLPEEMYSDNGLNFVGASRKLKEFYQWYHTKETKMHITRNGTRRGIKWSFNPPHAPHFGGLWEAGVRSVKRQMSAATGETPLTYEEFATLFAKIEAILNSRPLCPLSSDPEEAEYLSPGHFLVGGPLLAYPEPSHRDRQEHLLTRWQIVKRMYETFWKRWRLQYLTTLQKRAKWTDSVPNLAVGDLVLVRGPSQSAYTDVMHWPVARVTATHPGADGVVRVVTIRNGDSVFQRPAVELIPLLPLPDPKDSTTPSS